MQPDGVNSWYFKTIIIWSNIIHSLKYLRPLTLKCKDMDKKIRLCDKNSIPFWSFPGGFVTYPSNPTVALQDQ